MAAAARRIGRVAALAAAMAFAWLASPDALAQGCAMCRTAVEGQDDPLARALSASTLLLVAMPFAVFASVGGWIVFTLRRGGSAGPVVPEHPDMTPGPERDVSEGGVE